MKQLSLILFITFTFQAIGQDTLNLFKPYLLSTHPLGIFTSRINHNFNYKPAKQAISFTISRGNVWLPNVESRLPNKQSDRDYLNQYLWHNRNWKMDSLSITDYKSRFIHADGIFSTYNVSYQSPLNKKLELIANARFSSLTGGKVPVSLLTSDEFIEWFHSNIAGGEDAFGRKTIPFGEASLIYKDVNNNEIILKKNDFLISEISNYINYYPNWNPWGCKFNFSGLTGLSKINKTWHFDLGLSTSILKKFRYQRNWLDWGIASGILFPSLLQKQTVILNNLNHLISLESHWNYVIPRKKHQWVIGLNFHIQSNFHTAKENNYHVIYRSGNTSHDHYGMTHLNRWLHGWTLILGKNWGKWSVHTFLREDFWVDNAPDAQVGWGFRRQF